MAVTENLWRWGVVEIVTAIRDGEVSSREVVEAHIQRIAMVNSSLNGVTRVLHDAALQAADAADRIQASGAALGSLHGVPFTVKENIDLAGSATTSGVVALQNAVPAVDAPHVTQLKQAGAIPLARTNLPDFGFRWHTDNLLHGASVNPWDATRTPGGSSGGDAIALATGMTPLGLGNDFGGSLRFPAQCCGIAALRPTHGRVPRGSALAPTEDPISFQLFAVHGPMARRVRDLRLALASMSAPDARDPWCVPAPLHGPAAATPVKVAVCVDPGGGGVHPQVAEGIRRAAHWLAESGYAVEEVELPAVAEALETYMQIVAADVRATMLPTVKTWASVDTQAFVDYFMQRMPESSLQGYIQALAGRNGIARTWALFQREYPLILGPVCTEPPFVLGFDVAGAESVVSLMNSMRLSIAVNLLGLPAVAVPVGVADGLPQGVQLIGAAYREDLCLQAAEQLERNVGPLTPIDPKA